MAENWIKVEKATFDKPEVHQIASILNLDTDAVIGKLLRVWSWFDEHTVDGHASSVTFVTLSSLICRMTQVPNFADAMKSVGWLVVEENSVVMPNFLRHSGESAKKRALANARKAKQRSKSHADVTPMSRSKRDQNEDQSKSKIYNNSLSLCPTDFSPDDTTIARCKRSGTPDPTNPDILARFIAKQRSGGKSSCLWQDEYVAWMLNEKQYAMQRMHKETSHEKNARSSPNSNDNFEAITGDAYVEPE